MLNGLYNKEIIVIIVLKLMHGIGCEVKSLWAAIWKENAGSDLREMLRRCDTNCCNCHYFWKTCHK